jgi:hypothetical protein
MLTSGNFVLRFLIKDRLIGGFHVNFCSVCHRRPLRAVCQNREVDNDWLQPYKANEQRSSRAVSPSALS